MTIQLSEQQVLEALDKLSPGARRKALKRLVRGWDEFDRMVDRNQKKLAAICKKRGINFAALTDRQKEELIDGILHGD
jgi:hypothetical protein